MNKNKIKRFILSFITSACFGLLLAWILTFEQGSPQQILATLSIIVLLLFFHILSTRILNRSILIIYSYIEGIFFFALTMVAFRIGDNFLGITNLSLLTEYFLIVMGAIVGSAYVWSIRWAYKDQIDDK